LASRDRAGGVRPRAATGRPPQRQDTQQEVGARSKHADAIRQRGVATLEHIAEGSAEGHDAVEARRVERPKVADIQLVPGLDTGGKASSSRSLLIQLELPRREIGDDHTRPEAVEQFGETARAGSDLKNPVPGSDVALEERCVHRQGYTIPQGAVE